MTTPAYIPLSDAVFVDLEDGTPYESPAEVGLFWEIFPEDELHVDVKGICVGSVYASTDGDGYIAYERNGGWPSTHRTLLAVVDYLYKRHTGAL